MPLLEHARDVDYLLAQPVWCFRGDLLSASECRRKLFDVLDLLPHLLDQNFQFDG